MQNHNKIIIEQIDRHLADTDTIEKILEFHDTVHHAYFSTEVQNSREVEKKTMLTPPGEHEQYIRYYAFEKDLIVAYGFLYFLQGENEQNPEYNDIYVSVHPDYLNQGIGTRMLNILVDKALEIGKSKCIIWVRSDTLDGLAEELVKRLPLKLSLEEKTNRLLKDNINFDYMNDRFVDLKDKIHGKYKVEILEKQDYHGRMLENEVFAEEVSDFYNEVNRMIPKEDSELQELHITAQDLRNSSKSELASPSGKIKILVHDDKKIIGMSTTKFANPDHVQHVDTGMTGVRKSYQGQGIATYLKMEMLRYLLTKYPDFLYIDTENAQSNAAMIHINEKLGFRHVYSWRFYEGKIGELKHYLANK